MITLGLKDSIPFGQYKGFSVKFVIDTNKDYYIWMRKNVKSVSFTKEVSTYYKKKTAYYWYNEDGVLCFRV